MLLKVVGGGWCVFYFSKKSGCSSLPIFRSWNGLFFLFEIETLEMGPFRDWKKEKETTTTTTTLVLPLAWVLFTCLLLTFLCVHRLQGNPGQPG